MFINSMSGRRAAHASQAWRIPAGSAITCGPGSHAYSCRVIRTCLCLITRPSEAEGAAHDAREVLLGYKKSGFGAGRWVGLGGHIEDGEKPVEAAIREVAEESSLVTWPDSLIQMASLTFVFPARPTWDQTAEVFVTSEYSGQAGESDELVPRWFAASELPLEGMWDDAKFWLPVVLAGERVTATITFADDCATVAAIDPPLQARRGPLSGI